MQKLTISPIELQSLIEWIEKMEVQPHKIQLIGESTGIGFCIRAEVR